MKFREKMPGPEPGENWGVLGGVFDPVHRGHLTLARDIQAQAGLDGILFVPADKTPHRKLKQGASFDQRCHMLELALVDAPAFRLDRIERDAKLRGYTLDTVRELKKRYPDTVFRFIIGTDNLLGFKTWFRWEEVLSEIKLLVGCRPGADPPDLSEISPRRVELVKTSLVDLSSTGVRETIRKGASRDELLEAVPAPVADYILKERLYR